MGSPFGRVWNGESRRLPAVPWIQELKDSWIILWTPDGGLGGILGATEIPDELCAKVLREGIYLALIHDDEFELQVPDDFQPRAF
jgi:hypothetical protein